MSDGTQAVCRTEVLQRRIDACMQRIASSRCAEHRLVPIRLVYSYLVASYCSEQFTSEGVPDINALVVYCHHCCKN